MNNIFEECGSFIVPTDMPQCYLPEDVLIFGEDIEPTRPDLSVPAEAIAMLREAKEKHAPVMFTNEAETRALLIKDANNLNLKITVNGVQFEDI